MVSHRRRARIAQGLGMVVVAAASALLIRGLLSSTGEHECARRLAESVVRHDRAFLERVVRDPELRGQLMRAETAQLRFVRPAEAGGSEVGLMIRRASTATGAEVVTLRMPGDGGGGCSFVRGS